jgi:hypothetical protein
MEGCEIQGIFRDRLRVDGKLTNCETGDRLSVSHFHFLYNEIVYSLVLGIDYCVHLYHLYLDFYLDSCSRTQLGSTTPFIHCLQVVQQMSKFIRP